MDSRFDQIETAAVELFFEKGYHATSLRDIAQAVGIQAASIYHHFPSKQALLFSILSRVMDDLVAGGQAAVMEYSDPREQLRNLVRRHVTLHALRPKETIIGDTELRGLEGGNRVAVFAKRDEYQRLVERIVQFGERTGVFAVPDRKLAVYAIIEMCNQVGVWFHPGGRLTIDQVADVFAELALRLVGGDRHVITSEPEGDSRSAEPAPSWSSSQSKL